jgi:hypothetical protein
MKLALAALGCSLAAGCAHGGSPKQDLADWHDRHPQAAQELCAWIQQHPHASDRILTWQANDAARADELLRWAEQNPGFGWEAFVSAHTGWQDYAGIAAQHPRAANQLLDWGRRHPQAAHDLLEHQGALQFAGKHGAC